MCLVSRLGGVLVAGCAILGAACGTAYGQQYFSQSAKLHAGDPTTWHTFGVSVAIDGDTAIVGAQNEGDGTHEAAYVYQREGSTWQQVAKLTRSDGTNWIEFGAAVAIRGNVAVVGAYIGDAPSAVGAGAAYVFAKPPGGWVDMHETVKLFAADAQGGDVFGSAVATTGDVVAVGALGNHVPTSHTGSVYVFERPAKGWAACTGQSAILAGSSPTSDLGVSVSISGTTILAGCNNAAYVFERPGSSWSDMAATAQLSASTPLGWYYEYGYSVSLHGDWAVVGAPGEDCPGCPGDEAGAIYLFEKPPGGWVDTTETQKLIASDVTGTHQFGHSVAIDGEDVVVGSRYHDGASNSEGAAYIFHRFGSVWANEQMLRATDADDGDEFGRSVAIDDGTVLVGAHRDDDGFYNAGSAYVFTGRSTYDADFGACCHHTVLGLCTVEDEAVCATLGADYQGDDVPCGLDMCPSCGDGVQDPWEGCDDGNRVGGDGCDRNCYQEICGNGVWQRDIGEECDDGNLTSGDGCNAYCHYESPPAPVFYGQQETRSGSSADPVNTATGNLMHGEVDLSIASRGRPLVFARYYNSLDTNSGPLGPGWTHSYLIRLDDTLPDGKVTVRWGDGHASYWRSDGIGGYEPDVIGQYDELVDNGDGTRAVTLKSLKVYRFDAVGRLTSVADKNGNTTTLAYDDVSHPTLATGVTDPAGRAITLVYDGAGLLQSVTDFAVPPRQILFGYTSGRLTQVTDLLGHTIDYTYDGNGYLETINDQRSVTVLTNVYDVAGRVTEQVDGNGNATQFDYDTPAANQTTITRTVTVGEDPPHTLQEIHTHEDAQKLLLSIQNPLGQSVSFTYDGKTNRDSVTDRNGRVTTYVYDDRGNVALTKEADSPSDGTDGGTTTVAYSDPACPDVPTVKTDALGHITEWTYDGNCNVLTETRWLDEAQTEYVGRSWSYNTFGQRETATDERSHAHQWIYDSNGLLVEEIDREGNHVWYDHDELWRRTGLTDGRGTGLGDPAYTTSFAYDDGDRMTTVTSPPVGCDRSRFLRFFLPISLALGAG